MELVTETETDSLYSIVVGETNDGIITGSKSVSCKINLAHPFFTRFEQFKKGRDYEPIISIFKALTLAEIMAPERGTKYGANVRLLFNQYILH